jgi:hypothetical protein
VAALSLRSLRTPSTGGGCCGDWIEHLEEHGFHIEAVDLTDLSEIKARYQVPDALQSRHTAIVDGYVIEGHVPAAEIQKLLAERPAFTGLAVPEMPIGSPGMEVADMDAEPYNVIAFGEDGAQIYSSYR